MIYFTSDTHFDHARIIELCGRPFKDVDEMNETMVRNWNARVQPSDTVYHLGDFTMGGADVAEKFLPRLNGRINLIWGNHDRKAVRQMVRWHTSTAYTEINHLGKPITLCHYSLRVWNESHRGSLSLYGHSHNNLPGNSQSLDVGVDCWEFTPVTLDEIMGRMATLPAYKVTDTTGLFTRAYQEGEKQ